MRSSRHRTAASAFASLAGLVGAALLGACNLTEPGDPFATVVLAGQVVDTLGAPVAGVRVEGRGYRGNSCVGPSLAATDTDTSGADGAFALTLQALSTAFTGCAELVVQGQAEPQVSTRALGVRFREGAAIDTLRSTIVFRPAADAANVRPR